MSGQGSGGVAADRSTQHLLIEWGKWSWGGRPERPRCALAASSAPSAAITDSDATLIDVAMARLVKRKPLAARVLRAYYIEGKTDSQLAAELGVSRNTASSLRKEGIAWVDGALDRLEVNN